MSFQTIRITIPSIKSVFRRFRYKMSSSDAAGESCSWRGVSLTEIYGSQSPWGAPEFPLVSPAYNHAVLYHISSEGTQISDRPPKPQVGQNKWDHEHVRLPCSNQSLYPVESDGETTLKKRWEIIEESLQKPIENSEQLANAILSYNTKFRTIWKFPALHALFNEYLEEEEAQYFFTVTLPEIAKLALALPKLIQAPIPLLKQHKNRSISLSQQQIASLLANAFFCTFPRRNTTKRTSEYASYPHINFTTLYECAGPDSVLEKLKCICHYFRRVCTKVPAGVVTFTRRSVPPRRLPSWPDSQSAIANIPLHVNASGTIEDDGVGLIQVDFANKYLGGGVLGRGCVQEEIRFVICPELMLSMLFTEVLRPNESLLILGCERYSNYSGYGHSFRWSGEHRDVTPRDSAGRRRTAVLAIDAMPFTNKKLQFRADSINRELNKAWVGMSVHTSPEDPSLQRPGLATGNWGCGAFGGSATLKSLLQLMAACEARRPMAYYTFSDVDLRNNFINMYHLLAKHNVTVGQLYNFLVKFSESPVPKSQLYEYLHQSMVDAERGNESEKMDVSGSSDNQDSAVQPETKTSPPNSQIKPQEIKITIVPPDVKKPDNSPDMFSESPDTTPLSIGNVGIIEQYVQKNKVQITEERAKRTSRLFDEMNKLDDESGKMNFDKQKEITFLSHDTSLTPNRSLSEDRISQDANMTNNRSMIEDRKENLSVIQDSPNLFSSGVSDSKIETDEMLNSSDVPAEVKKSLSKKITDYFSRKT